MRLEAVTVEKDGRIQAFLPNPEGCSCHTFFKAKHSTFDFSNPEKLPLQPRQVIELQISPGKSILTSFVFFILPLLLAGAAFLITKSLTDISWLPTMVTLSTFPVSLLIYLLYTHLTKVRFRPTLVRVLDKESEECMGCKDCAGCPSAPIVHKN